MDKKWTITKVFARPTFDTLENVVSAITWTATYTSTTGKSVSVSDTFRVELPTVTSNFTNYAEMTQEDLLLWVLRYLGDQHLQLIDNELTAKLLAVDEAPTLVLPDMLPWAPKKDEEIV